MQAHGHPLSAAVRVHSGAGPAGRTSHRIASHCTQRHAHSHANERASRSTERLKRQQASGQAGCRTPNASLNREIARTRV